MTEEGAAQSSSKHNAFLMSLVFQYKNHGRDAVFQLAPSHMLSDPSMRSLHDPNKT